MANQKYNTGLTRSQISEALRRALNDMTDSEIRVLIHAAKTQVETEISAKAAVGDIYGAGTIMSASSENPVDLNNITAIGRYQCGQSASAYVLNRPISQNYGFALTVATNGLASRYRQTVYLNSDTYAGIFYERYFTTNGWTAWYKFTGEAVT